jgi:peptide/nickel transport system permease protein
MGRYLVRRLIQGAVILIIITIVSFAIITLSTDPMAQYNNNKNISAEDKARIAKSMGLDQPIYVQYVVWLGKALRGDLGLSTTSKEPVSSLILDRLPKTLVLMISAYIVIIVVSLFLGVFSAVKKYSVGDNVVTAFSFVGFSMPVFFIGLSLIYIFAVQFKAWGLPYLPTGTGMWDQNNPVEWARHLILPVATLALISIAGYTRYLRSSMLETMNQDYVRTARSKGLSDRAVLWQHALKNAMLPFITLVALEVPLVFTGALVTETVFSWPGMGRLFWEFADKGDFNVMMGILLIAAVLVVVGQIIVDIGYTFLDPRIKLA